METVVGGQVPSGVGVETTVEPVVGVGVAVEVREAVVEGVAVAVATVMVLPAAGNPLKLTGWPLVPVAPVTLEI